MTPSISQWDPDSSGPMPTPPASPSPIYGLKFVLNHLRAAASLGDCLYGFATVEYVVRKSLGQADLLPRYCRAGPPTENPRKEMDKLVTALRDIGGLAQMQDVDDPDELHAALADIVEVAAAACCTHPYPHPETDHV